MVSFLIQFQFVPKGYHVGYIYFASRGKEGYKLEELPTFSDE